MEDYGFGLWAVVLKETNAMIGKCGLTLQPWKGKRTFRNRVFVSRRRTGIKVMQRKRQSRAGNMRSQSLNADSVCSMIQDTI